MAFSGTYDIATATNPTSALTDFTFIVDLSTMSTAWWAAVDTSDGTKGRASKGDGVTELACDWIDFNDTAETGLLRVKWSGTLASSGTQQVRIYPPKAANISYGVSDTYGQYNAYSTEWVGYWPLCNDANDRTVNQNNGTASGGLTFGGSSVNGWKATAFDGIDDIITVPDSSDLTFGDGTSDSLFTLSANIYIGNRSSLLGIAGKASGFNSGEYYLASFNAQILNRCVDDSGSDYIGKQTSSQILDADHYISAGYSGGGTNADIDIWVDGSVVSANNSGTASYTAMEDTSTPFYIGSRGLGNYFNGNIFGVSIHSNDTDSNFQIHESYQTNDNATFWGTWTNVPVGGAFTLDADTGTYLITGSDVSLTADRQIQAESGTYNITGSAVDLLATRLIGADSGTYALTGSDVSLDLSVGFTLNADSGSFTINGSDVSLDRTYVLNADSGNYNLSGSDVILDWSGEVITFYKSVAINGDITSELEVLGSITISKSILGEIG